MAPETGDADTGEHTVVYHTGITNDSDSSYSALVINGNTAEYTSISLSSTYNDLTYADANSVTTTVYGIISTEYNPQV
ncbi:MAG: hypothetical protein Q4Q62_04010 [Thermoplasmata archaeon]|nr:hypothetical protein [Thermoplasmata archaeon]